MEVLQEKDGTIIKFGRKLSRKEIDNIQSYLKYARAVKGSIAKPADIEQFAEKAKQDTWERYKKNALR